MPTNPACAPIPPQPSRRWEDSFSLQPPSWRRQEVLDLVHPVDDVIGVLRRVRLVEGMRPKGVQAAVAYELALDLQSQLHALVRLLEPPSTRSD